MEKFKIVADLVKHYQIGILLSLMMLFLCFVMFSWAFAFWSNGLRGTSFDLNSCWQGITVVATGLGSVAAFAVMPYVKHWTDSKYNSEIGEAPTNKEHKL